ncbi:MAG: DEAD/DEAH box helicase [Ignavibacteriales bacterium]|nr:DEAD/DEAH box helicase [Ignavibacteriales bacterium]
MINTFDEMGLDEKILKAIKELGFEIPMPIQEKVIPYLMQPKCDDIVALAQTGTGKTAAFGLPIIQKTDTTLKNIQYLILAPTRELCLQIADDLANYAKYKSEIKIAAVFGGASIDRQIQMIRRGAHIISATPGRLLDMINRNIIDLSKIKTVVLDEADEMLNMGFRDDLESILKETPKSKNTLLFSATMPPEILTIANRYMNKPVEITVGKRNAGAENVHHVCYMVHAKDRYLALKRIADYNPEIYGIIFCRTRAETQEVADQLMQDGYNADALHGDLSQQQRDAVMNKFRIKHLKLLVATDVAARGLDVENLTHIINYNLPDELDLYTHRSGRTGRAGKAGISIIIANLKEKFKLQQIEKKLNKKFSHLPVPLGKDICEKQLFYLVDKIEKVEVDDSNIDAYLPEIYKKLEWLDREELIKKFVSVEFNRFLDYYKNTPDLNIPLDEKRSGRSRTTDAGFTRFFINLGRTDELRPVTLMDMISEFTGKRNIEIGAIEILQNFSFFEVDSNYADAILKSFENKKLRNRQISVEVAAARKSEGRSESWKERKPRVGDRKPFHRERFEKRDGAQRPERTSRTERTPSSDRSPRTERSPRSDSFSKPDKYTRSERSPRSEKPSGSGKSFGSEKPLREKKRFR